MHGVRRFRPVPVARCIPLNSNWRIVCLSKGVVLPKWRSRQALGLSLFGPHRGFSPEHLPRARGSMAGIAVAENQYYLAGRCLVCDKKAEFFDHDVWNVFFFDENGKQTRK